MAIANLRGHRQDPGRCDSLWYEHANAKAAKNFPWPEGLPWARRFAWRIRIAGHDSLDFSIRITPVGVAKKRGCNRNE
jgi:hypothetical protein